MHLVFSIAMVVSEETQICLQLRIIIFLGIIVTCDLQLDDIPHLADATTTKGVCYGRACSSQIKV